ncbi:MAG: ATP-binding cassette domain-containing protein [Ardenticatenaceae bacterium]|nr:ATP-binding cassette domain-containing protein [Ardenticatenaceae bacterium]
MSYAYPSAQPGVEPEWVLDGVDLEIAAGEFVAIMGATGGGKTTLCLALNGIVPHSTGGIIGGDVLVNGLNTKRHSVAELAQSVGLVFQEPETQLFNMTVEMEVAFGLENLGLSRAEMDRRIGWALSLVKMANFRQRAPFQLSGGQKQRVAIAAMLAMQPKILVLDEPTANLDPVGKREVFTAVQTLRHQLDMTIIMVSHESEQIAEFADRVVVLDKGKVALAGGPTAVFPQIPRLQQIGLAAPQVSEVAYQINQQRGTNYNFVRLEDVAWEAGEQSLVLSPQSLVPSLQSPLSPSPAMVIHDLHFGYDPTTPVLNGISLTIGRGEMVALLGQNGSGKTTLAKQVNGLLRPFRGTIHLFGQDSTGQTVGELSRTVGYVFQNPDHQIFSPTVREEIAVGPRNLGLDEADVARRVEVALVQFGLQPYADMQPALLSFGLRRKVSVAAVVAMDTAVLILDEPTTGLDWRSTQELMAILHDLRANGRTILIITHDMRLVADHISRCLLLQNGRLLADSPTRTLFPQTALLHQAQIEPPQIIQLAQRMNIPDPILTVPEFCNYVMT